jgi:hypothetical protein
MILSLLLFLAKILILTFTALSALAALAWPC